MHRVVSVVGPKIALFELAVACEVFGIGRPELPQWDYEHVVCAVAGSGDAGQGGLRLETPHGIEAIASADTVLIPAWSASGNEQEPDVYPAAVVQALVDAHARGARLVSVCTGAFLLASTGLLDGRRATTHWMHAEELARRFPAVDVDPTVLYIDEGSILTSAGTAAGIDLCLHLVRLDLGAEAANTVARRMVVPPHRDGGQAQFVHTPVPACAADDPLGPVLAWMVEHL
ncbi:MAG: DJ-1/PfpI family protein, partial [Acidimicrobiales bacterium]